MNFSVDIPPVKKSDPIEEELDLKDRKVIFKKPGLGVYDVNPGDFETFP